MTTDEKLAAELARSAGELLLGLRDGAGYAGKELGRHGDAESNALLPRGLAEARPADAVLSGESADSPARLTADRVWIIDPLDGSREYGLPGREDWAVHVALWQRGSETPSGITAAAVAQALDADLAPSGSAWPRPFSRLSRPRSETMKAQLGFRPTSGIARRPLRGSTPT
jgi:3'(2'), 5'-bisphosphate nucleotidase